jgi:hypothetical protein
MRITSNSLAHCRRDALHAVGPDVTHGEDTRKTCFENKRSASQRPVRGHQVGLRLVPWPEIRATWSGFSVGKI